jgi:preprotein translocase subunit YajC
MSCVAELLMAEIHIGDCVLTEYGSEGRVVSVGRKTARIEISAGGNYTTINCLLSQLRKTEHVNPRFAW